MKKKIIWITADYFLDVDLPVIPQLATDFEIEWYILVDSAPIDKIKISSMCNEKNIKFNYIFLKYKWYSPLSFFEIRSFFKQINRQKPDLIYFDLTSYSYTYIIADLIFDKNNVVFATHNVTTPKGARMEKLAKLNMFYLLHRFRNFHVFSKNQQKVLESRVSKKNILYAPLALKDYGIPTGCEKGNIKNFISFGHIRNYKRIDLLIEAAQSAYEQTQEKFIVTIAGNCKDWSSYEQLIKYPFLFDLKIGYIKDDDIPLLFAKSDYLVLPYQDLAQSGVITVAFNYNLPVIASDIPQFEEFVAEGDNGFLFKTKSVESLTSIIVRCLEMNSDEYQKLIHSVKLFVSENYSMQSIRLQYVDYFNKLIQIK